ncbi:MAG: iron-containing alcohol dehydrogenase [Treponema sp.]|nr:iron-containing alcohol dehydrogenase [Treponema sp.]
MDISFKFNPEVHIGADTLSIAGTVASRHGSKIMVAADHALDTEIVKRLKSILEDSGLKVIVFDGIEAGASGEPANPAFAENIVELSRAAHCDAIIGIGGQQAQVIARMAAIMAPMKLSAFNLFDDRIHHNKFLPLISIPTESTCAFSLTEYFVAPDPRNKLLKLIQFPGSLYSAVIVDSSLFKLDSNKVSASGFVFEGLLTAVEAYCSTRANFLSDSLLEKALPLFAKLLRSGSANSNGGDGMTSQAGFADNYAQASFLASFGSALSSPGFGVALSAAINARTPIPKPLCSAVLFPLIVNRLVNTRPEKTARLATLLGTPKAASVADTAKSAPDIIRRIMGALKIPTTLKEHNIPLDRLTAAAEAARNLEFVSNSPWPVSEEEVFNILKEIF